MLTDITVLTIIIVVIVVFIPTPDISLHNTVSDLLILSAKDVMFLPLCRCVSVYVCVYVCLSAR